MFGVSKVGASIPLLRLVAGSAKPLCGALCMNKVYSIYQGSVGSAGGVRAGRGEVEFNTPTYCLNYAYRLADPSCGFAEGWP